MDDSITLAVSSPRPSISVTGRGEIMARPDILEITAGVHTRGASAQAAARENGDVMNRILAALKEHGIAEKDVQTTRLSVSPQYNQPNPRSHEEYVPRIVGYVVENQVRIVSRRLDQAGPLLDAVMNAGANQVHGVQFRIEHPEKLYDEARKRAMADAKGKAMLLAGEAGVVVGPPRSISEHEGNVVQPQPMFRAAAMAGSAPMLPVAPGEERISVNVSVVYELLQPK